MRIELNKGSLTIHFSNQEKMSGLLTLKHLTETRVTASNVPEVEAVCHKLYTLILRERIAKEQELTKHTCIKCFSTVDTTKDRFHHASFPNGDSTYQHIECSVKTYKEQLDGS